MNAGPGTWTPGGGKHSSWSSVDAGSRSTSDAPTMCCWAPTRVVSGTDGTALGLSCSMTQAGAAPRALRSHGPIPLYFRFTTDARQIARGRPGRRQMGGSQSATLLCCPWPQLCAGRAC